MGLDNNFYNYFLETVVKIIVLSLAKKKLRIICKALDRVEPNVTWTREERGNQGNTGVHDARRKSADYNKRQQN